MLKTCVATSLYFAAAEILMKRLYVRTQIKARASYVKNPFSQNCLDDFKVKDLIIFLCVCDSRHHSWLYSLSLTMKKGRIMAGLSGQNKF